MGNKALNGNEQHKEYTSDCRVFW